MGGSLIHCHRLIAKAMGLHRVLIFWSRAEFTAVGLAVWQWRGPGGGCAWHTNNRCGDPTGRCRWLAARSSSVLVGHAPAGSSTADGSCRCVPWAVVLRAGSGLWASPFCLLWRFVAWCITKDSTGDRKDLRNGTPAPELVLKALQKGLRHPRALNPWDPSGFAWPDLRAAPWPPRGRAARLTYRYASPSVAARLCRLR